jgi:aspartate aminotransferase
MNLSSRVSELKPSTTVAMANRAKVLMKQGIDVLSYAAGEPDFDTPVRIKEAAIEALKAGQTKYMPTLGDVDTRKVLADKLTRENSISGLTPEHVAISAGGKHALFVAMHCLLNDVRDGAKDEVLLPVPAWVSYAPIVELAGGKIIELSTTPQSDFKITPEQLRKAITPRSKVLILNSPSNPCGTMYTPEELKAIGRVVAEGAKIAPNLVVYTDELYEKIVYGGIPHFSIGSMPEIAERTITLNGLSKAYAMTGWRVGYTAMPGAFGKKFIESMGTLQGQMTTNITSFVYPAIRTAITSCADDVERMRQAFASRAALIHRRMGELPGVLCPRPTGAFYVFPDVSAHFGKVSPGPIEAGKSAPGDEGPSAPIRSALAFCEALLKHARVAAVPGEDFGGCGPKHVRFSFACSDEQINKGMDRLGVFLKNLK